MSKRIWSICSAVRWLWIVSSALLGACSTDVERTEVVVAVHSDLEPGRELNKVTVETYDLDGNAVADGATFHVADSLPAADEVRLPFKVTVYKRTKDAFLLRVTGYGPPGGNNIDQPIVEYKARIIFRKGKILLLKVFLGRACLAQLCGADASCYSDPGDVESDVECSPLVLFDNLPEARRGHELEAIASSGGDQSGGDEHLLDGGSPDSSESGHDAGAADLADTLDSATNDRTGEEVLDAASGPTCASGYREQDAKCVDIDECFEGTDRCHQSANCANTDGSYNCTCPEGYSGGGSRGIACMSRIAAGADHGCGVTPDGIVRCWGDNTFGQLGDGTTAARAAPTAVEGLSAVAAVVAAGNTTCALMEEGTIGCWGENAGTVWGDGSRTPVALQGLEDVVQLSIIGSSGGGGCAVDREGSVWCWGRTIEDVDPLDEPTRIAGLGPVSWVTAALGPNASVCAALRNREAYCWGKGMLTGPQEITSSTPARVPRSDALLVLPMNQRVCVLHYGGAVSCWGNPYLFHSEKAGPIEVMDLGSATALAGGTYQTCILGSSPGLICWNAGTEPAPVEGGEEVVAISIAIFGQITYGLTTDGEVKAWNMFSPVPTHDAARSVTLW